MSQSFRQPQTGSFASCLLRWRGFRLPAQQRWWLAALLLAVLVVGVLPGRQIHLGASALQGLVGSYTGGGGGPQQFCGPMDVAFVVDDTGSMGSVLGNVKSGLASVLDRIQTASGGDYRLALVTPPNDNVQIEELFAPHNRDAFAQKLNALSAGGGNGEPESTDECVNTIVNALPAAGRRQNIDFSTPFRPGALKIVILVTDAHPGGFHDSFTVGVDDVHVHQVSEDALAKNIQISSIFSPTSSSYHDEIAAIMQDYARTSNGVYHETGQGGTGAGDALDGIITDCGNIFGHGLTNTIYTRDDLLHGAFHHALTPFYSTFAVQPPATAGNSVEPATFDMAGISGTVLAARMLRAGQITHSSDGTMDLQWGLQSLASPDVTSYGPLQASVQTLPSPYPYQQEWTLPGSFATDIAGQLGHVYAVSLADRLSSLCGNYAVADTPHQNWPGQKNILTFMVASGTPKIPQGRCLDVMVPGGDAPLNGRWDVTLGNAVIASSGQPNGWDVEDDHTAYGGVHISVPPSAGASLGYEVRCAGAATGSAYFEVVPSGSSFSAPVLRPLLVSPTPLTGGTGATGTISLDAPAPEGGATVSLYTGALGSQAPAAAVVPASVTVPQGQTSASFPIATQAVPSPTPVAIFASYNGYRQATVTLLDGSGGGTPPTPLNLTATGGDGQVALQWSAATGATRYNLARSQTKGGPYAPLFRGLSRTNFVDTAVTNGTTYYYVVSAANDYGQESAPSAPAAATPIGGQVATPTITPNGGTFTGSVNVFLSETTGGSTIHYTLDGSDPSLGSPAYRTAFTLTGNATVKARAFRNGSAPSGIASAAFVVKSASAITYTPIDCGQTKNGTLSSSCPYSTVRGQGYYAGFYSLTGTAGETVTLSLNSAAFDAVLYLKDASGNLVASNDDSNGTSNSQIVYTLPAAGTYTIEATSFAPGRSGNNMSQAGGVGDYTLTLQCANVGGAAHLALAQGTTTVPNNATPQTCPVLAFGATPMGVPVTKTFTITNTGTVDLTISQADIPYGFTLVQAMGSPVLPGQSTTFILRFDANWGGYQSGTVRLTNSDGPQNPFQFLVDGTATYSSSSNPTVPQGGCNTFPPNHGSYEPVPAHWAIYDPSGTKIASDATTDGPGPNGWTASSSGGNSVSVCAPAAAPVATGYRVEVNAGQNSLLFANFDVVPNGVGLTRLALAPDPVVGGNSAQGTVTLSGAAPAGGSVVSLATGNAAVAALPQSSVTVPAGQTSATFTITTSSVTGPTDVSITATDNGTATATLTVTATPTAAAPVIRATNDQGLTVPSGARFNGALTVTLQSATPGATIYYTRDGSAPTRSSATYYGPLTVSGTTTIKALAGASGYADSAVASATFTLNALPTVALTQPADGATPHAGDALTLAASASDTDGTIRQVDFYQGSALLGTATAAPYTVSWPNVPAGAYTLTAVATDNDGGQTTSAPVHITVSGGLTTTTIDCGQSVSGRLSTTDGFSAIRGQGVYADHYSLSGTAGAPVTISLTSGAFDAYLYLLDSAGNVVASNDDSNGTSNSLLSVTLPAAGTYTVEATSYAPNQTGPYTLRLDCNAAGAAPAIAVSTPDGTNVPSGTTVDFGASPVGTPVTKTFTITNVGNADLAISSYAGSSNVFASTASPSSPVPPQLTTSFTIRFTPDSNGAKTGTITLGNNSGTNPFTITLTGTGGTGTALTVSSLTLNPASVAGGSPSAGTVTLSGAAPAGGQTVRLVSSAASASVPASIVVPQGQTTAMFRVTTSAVAVQTTATLTASIGTAGQPGFSSQSATLTVTPAGTVPTVTLSASPTSAPAPATITLTATASATTSGATIAKVEFFQGTTKIGEASASPYTFTWKNVPGGTYSLTAKVTDSNGLTATSAAVSVTVTTAPALVTVISPNGGTFTGTQAVTLSAQNGQGQTVSGAQIYYTLDGSDPAPLWTLYTQPFTLMQTATVTAKSSAGGYAGSPLVSATFTSANTSGGSLTAEITSPADSNTQTDGVVTVSAPTDIKATLSGASAWQLSYRLDGDSLWAPFASGTVSGAVSAQKLTTWDTTLLVNGLYQIQLTAVDAAGHAAAPAVIELVVQGGQKVGYFTLSYNDLTIPVAGFPLTVTRTYDSRVKTGGDFGVGWTLSTNNIRLQKSPGKIGDGWTETYSGNASHVRATQPHTITLTFPDGQVYSFAATLNPSDVSFDNIYGGTLQWVQQSGPKGATLTPVNASPDVYTSDTNGPIELGGDDADGFFVSAFDTGEFVLRTRDGRQFDIVAGSPQSGGGLQSIKDLNGNTLTFSPSGITSSSGKAITFTRGAGGYITGITDPLGNGIAYGQDAQGNLTSVTDRAGNTSTYDYDGQHLLIGLHDPRGLTPLTNHYDASGRLLYSTDAQGQKITYNYAASFGGTAPASTEITTDRLGNQTLLGYDGYGNVTSGTRYLKRPDGSIDHAITITAQYGDANNPDKKTQQIDALGRETDFQYDSLGSLLTVTQYKVKGDPTSALTTKTTYNGLGQPLTVSDPLGHVVTTNVYDANGSLTTTTDALGHPTGFAYNANGTLSQTTDAKGNVTKYAYDATDSVTLVADTTGHATRFTYNADGDKTSQTTTRTNAQGQTETLTTQFSYDGDDRLIQTIAPDGAPSTTVYNSLGKVDHTTDALGRKTSYTYDALGQVTSTAYPDGTSASITYDRNGQQVSSTDKAGRVSASVYDSLGRLTQSGPVVSTAPWNADGTPNFLKDAAGHALNSATTYDDGGQVTQAQDALGHKSSSSYDDLGRKLTSTDGLGFVTKYEYDDAGRQSKVTDANGHAATYDYDDAGRLLTTHYADSSTSSTAYDELGRRTSQTDQAGHTVSYAYDTRGRLSSVTDGLGHVSSFGYDELGEKTSQTDAGGHITKFAYDNRGRLLSKMLPGTQTDGRTYDGLGRLSTQTDFNGVVTAFGYDPTSGRLLAKTAYAGAAAYAAGTPDGDGVSFTYNPDGTRATATRTTSAGSSVTTTYAYYPTGDFRQGQLQSVTTASNGTSRTITYDYDVLGEKVSTQTPSLGTNKVLYGYDADSRLVTVTHPDGAKTTFTYDKAGNRQSVIRQNGLTTTYTYDSLNRLTDLANTNAASAVVSSFHYMLRADGKRLSVTESGPSTSNATTAYTYDNAGKLVQEAGPYGTIAYAYDNVGNRLSKTVTGAVSGTGLVNGTTTSAYDQNDRLTTPGHSYDADGNETTVNGQAATYDFENHLTGLGNAVASYVYDADGNRVSVTTGGTTTSYLVDTSLPYASVVEEYSGSTLSARYDYGDDLIRMDRGSGVYYYLYDGLGSTRQLSSNAGAVTNTYAYDAFGNGLSHTGSTVNPFLFNAQQFDAPTGDYYLRARYYDQSNGRFISQDPLEGSNEDPISLHRYLYAGDDPVNSIDPSGEESICELSVSLGINTSLTATTFAVASRTYSVATTLADAVNLYYDYEATGAVDTGDVVNLTLDVVLPKLGPALFKGLFAKWLCFVAGTPVVMADGNTKKIENIRIGDMVLSRDEVTGKTQAKKVLRLFQHQAKQTLTLHFRGGATVETTPTHPFYVQGRGFVPAGQLTIGTSIVTRAGPNVVLVRVEHHSKPVTVYNFEVEGFHTYFVSKDELWVHNQCTRVANWVSGNLWNTGKNSTVLAKALGILPNTQRAAHHIVASTATEAEEARDILDEFQIGINTAENGVDLPASIHTGSGLGKTTSVSPNYYEVVNQRLKDVVRDAKAANLSWQQSRARVIFEIQAIGAEIDAGAMKF